MDRTGYTPLHISLLADEADDNDGRTAVALLPINDVAALEINKREANGVTPLMLAAGRGLLGVIKALVSKGAAVDACDNKGETALTHAMNQRQDVAASYLLEETSAAWDESKVMRVAAELGLPRVLGSAVRRMRADGANEAMVVAHIQMAALHAVRTGGASIMILLQSLVKEGLDVTQSIPQGRTAHGLLTTTTLLHMASRTGYVECVAFLVAQGCDPTQRDGDGCMPHHIAAQHGRLRTLQWLLANARGLHVDEESVNTSGRFTALHHAVIEGHLEVVEWLVETAGADVARKCVGLRGFQGLNPLELAAMHGHTDVAMFLREYQEARAAAARVEEELTRSRQAFEERQRGGKKLKGVTEEARQSTENGGAADVVGEDMVRAESPPARRPPPLRQYLQQRAPFALRCPITLQLLQDPVLLVADGCTYSRAAIERHFATRREGDQPLTSPVTNMEMTASQAKLVTNVLVRGQVMDYRQSTTKEWERAELRWRKCG